MAMLMCIYSLKDLVENYADTNQLPPKEIILFILNLHHASHAGTWGGVLKKFTVP